MNCLETSTISRDVHGTTLNAQPLLEPYLVSLREAIDAHLHFISDHRTFDFSDQMIKAFSNFLIQLNHG
jgi:hypothetical protein